MRPGPVGAAERALVERLRGTFAFAVWDPPSDRLVLARDRLGVKPDDAAAARGPGEGPPRGRRGPPAAARHHRPPENGFSVPFADRVRPGGVLADRVRALAEPSGPSSGSTYPAVVRRIADEHARRAADHRTLLWSLVALDVWARVFLGPAPRPQSLPGAAV